MSTTHHEMRTSWRVGTELRESGKYSWVLPSGKVKTYDSVTSVLKPHFAAGFAQVQPFMVAKKCAELVGMAKRKENHSVATGWVLDPVEGRWEREYSTRSPIEALEDVNWLRYEGDRFLTRAAHRGSTTHALLPLWEMGVRMTQEDIKYWVPDHMAEKGYLCDEDETVGYCLALNHFLHEHQPRIRLSEKPVFHDDLEVAGTMDGYWSFDGKWWDVADAKTSEAVRAGFAEQAAAYFYAKKIGHPKPDCKGSGIRRKMPRSHGAIVILIQPEGVTPRRVRDLPAAWESFKSVHKIYKFNKGSLFETIKEKRIKI